MRSPFRLIAVACVAVVGLSIGSTQAALGKAEALVSRPQPDRAGELLQTPGSDTVYLVDPDGYRRGVPGRETFDALFRDRDSVAEVASLDDISERPDLSRAAFLGRLPESTGVYLFTDHRRFGIASASTMDKYHFDKDKVQETPVFVFRFVQEGRTWR